MVALKTLTKELAKKADFVARFEREAKSMAKNDHPNVVKIYAVDSYKGIHFAAIEYIDGRVFKSGWIIWGNSPLLTPFTSPFLRGSAEACSCGEHGAPGYQARQYAHHKEGIVKVADFGLAKAMDEDVSMTQSGTGLGTPLYMAPEQARNAKHVDHRSDIMLWERPCITC